MEADTDGAGSRGRRPNVVTRRLQSFLDEYMDGTMGYDRHGLYPIHKLCDLMRTRTFGFDEALWVDMIVATVRMYPDGVNVTTKSTRPPNACPLALAAKQPWKCAGCQPRDQVNIVEFLIAYGADQRAVSDHGNTFLQDIAGGATFRCSSTSSTRS